MFNGILRTLEKVGERKCEANALVIDPQASRDLVETAILSYIGNDALDRFEERRQGIRDQLKSFRADTGLTDKINEIIEIVEDN